MTIKLIKIIILSLIGFVLSTCNNGIGGKDYSYQNTCTNGHAFLTIQATCTSESVPGTCTRLGCNTVNPEGVIPALGHEGIV